MNELNFLTASQLAQLIRERKASAVEVLDAHLKSIAQHNPKLNAIVTLDAERAVQRAREADEALARGEIWGPLHGVPVTIKDSFETAGLRTTSGYTPFADYVPQRDAAAVTLLRQAGAIILGKTNLPPLAKAGNPSIRSSGARTIRGTSIAHRAAVRVAARRRWPPVCHQSIWKRHQRLAAHARAFLRHV